MYKFGNWLTRAIRGGITLAPAEQWLLAQLVKELPEHLQATVQAQLRSYNLAQREIDGRAINLYRQPIHLAETPLLQMSAVEAPLIRLSASAGAGDPVHATLNAVSGRVFCMAFSRPAQALAVSDLEVVQITEAWRSSFPVSAPNNSFKPNPLRSSKHPS